MAPLISPGTTGNGGSPPFTTGGRLRRIPSKSTLVPISATCSFGSMLASIGILGTAGKSVQYLSSASLEGTSKPRIASIRASGKKMEAFSGSNSAASRYLMAAI